MHPLDLTRKSAIGHNIRIQKKKQKVVVAQVKRRRERWREKMIENEGSLVNRVINGQVAGKTPRGRPKNRWTDEF